MESFRDRGLPFSLFEGPVKDASGVVEGVSCSLCHQSSSLCFALGIGCAVMVRCPSCQVMNGLDADDRAAQNCRVCGAGVQFPRIQDEELVACYGCLRAGHAAITKDTELGMISWEQAFEGVTHGTPGLDRDDFALVPLEEGWIGARLPEAMMFELLRTPTYETIQGEQWQFCCRQPMVFLGTWSRQDFTERAPDRDGRRLFDQVVQEPIAGLWEDELHDVTGVYVFRCSKCTRMTAHWDIA